MEVAAETQGDTVLLHIRIPRSMWSEVKATADELAITIAALVRLILRTWLRARRIEAA